MGYSLQLAFDRDERQFVFGVEVGTTWEKLKATPGDEEYEQSIHLENAEMALRMAEATGRPVQSEEAGDGCWMTVTFGPRAA